MAHDLFLAFATPDDSVDEAEFNEFQNRHNEEILEVPGFVAVRRYSLRRSNSSGFPSTFGYMTMYEVTLPIEQLFEELARTAPERHDPEWFPGAVSLRAVSARSLDGNPDPTATDHAYLVFTGTPEAMTFDEYYEWNVGHQAVNIDATSLLDRGFLFGLSYPEGNDGSLPDFFEAYSLLGDPRQMLDEIHAKTGVVHPDGFRHFSSLEATAVAPQKRSSS